MSERPLVSVVLPTYNERENIEEVLRRLVKSLNGYGEAYEIIVVDDNSPDGTAEAAERIARELGRIKVVKRYGVRGLASAVFEGLRKASGDVVVVMDADLQHPPEMVPSLVSLVHKLNYDIAIASRYARGSRVSGWSFPRRVLSKLGVLLARLLLPEARVTSDPLSGFFALRRDLVPNAVASGRGFKVLLPLLKHALQENPTLRVVDVSFTFHPRSRGKSKLGIGTVVSDLLQLLRLSGYRPFRFAAVGSLGTLVNLGAMYLAYKVLGLPYVVGSVVGIEASITFNFTLHEGWTFRERRWRLSSGILRRLAGFHGSSAASILTTFTSAVMFKEVLGVEPLIGQFVGILIGFVLNYTISELGVWR